MYASPSPHLSPHQGFGFVCFRDTAAANAALAALHETPIPGATGPDGSEQLLYVARAQKREERLRMLAHNLDVMRVERFKKWQGVNVYVRNLDESFTKEELVDEFAPYGTITSAKVAVDAAGNSRLFGFVCFSSAEEATRAIYGEHNKLVRGKPLYVALWQPKDLRRANLAAQLQRVAMGAFPPGAGPRGGMPFMGQEQIMFMGGGRPMFPGFPMGRGGPAGFGPMAGGPPRGFPFMVPGIPGMHGMAPAVSPSGRGRRGGRGGPAGGRGGSRGGAGGAPRGRPYPLPGMFPPPPAAPLSAVPVAAPDVLAADALANATPEERKNLIGERLYGLISQSQPSLAGKITGMLLEGMDTSELLHLIESPESLGARIVEALEVLGV